MPTDFNNIIVDPINHGYRIGDKNLISVTTLIKSIIPEFDKDNISLRMAQRTGTTQADILRQWNEKANRSKDKGTRLHQYIEDVITNKIDPIMCRINDRIQEMTAFDNAWTKMRAELDAKMIKQEFVIGDEEYGIAGRVDNLLSIKPPNYTSRLACLFDWKTGKFEITNPYEKLLPPFDTHDNCKLNEYSIQLSLYRLIIERNNPNTILHNSYILHLRDDGSYQLHRSRDLREEIKNWLKNGVPQSAYGNPATEKQAQELIKTIDTNIDQPFIKKLSERTKHDLHRAARTIITTINSTNEDD